ncbi:response regulator transcription factor [Bosea thiooxidans]|nr:LuxR C-terminal-related transcriptional regulator [Bosea thiooxidans]
MHIVDGDAASQAGIDRMLRACGYETRAYVRADDILKHRPDGESASCVVIDTSAPDESIPDVVSLFSKAGLNLPVIFLTDRGDARVGVRAIKAGAEDFFTKPIERDEFIGAIDRAISRHRLASEQESWVRTRLARLQRLTRREREVFELVVRGKMNKQVAFTLGTTERTIKAHRHKVMEKMQVCSVVELVTCAERLGLLRPSAP